MSEFSKNRPTSAAIQTGSIFDESVCEVLPHYDDLDTLGRNERNHPSGEFLLQKETETRKSIRHLCGSTKSQMVINYGQLFSCLKLLTFIQ